MTDQASGAPVDRFRAIYQDRFGYARRWHADGGTVIGYLCDNVPTELIHAADCLPLRLVGGPKIDTAIVSEKIDRLYPPDLSQRPGFVASIAAQLLSGSLDFVDGLVIPHNRHPIQALYRELTEARQHDPSLRLPQLHYLDKAWSPLSPQDGFNRNAVIELRSVLERWSGQQITDAAVDRTVVAGRQARAAIREISQTRLREGKIAGTEALWAYAAATVLPPAEFVALADTFIEASSQRPKREGPRVFVGGSPLDDDHLYSRVERLGATIVAEDHCWGARLGDEFEGEGGRGIDAIAARYHAAPACSIRQSFELTLDASLKRAEEARVDAAIIYVMRDDAIQSWDAPDLVKALRSSGIPTLHLADQDYAGGDDAEVDRMIGELFSTLERGDAA